MSEQRRGGQRWRKRLCFGSGGSGTPWGQDRFPSRTEQAQEITAWHAAGYAVSR